MHGYESDKETKAGKRVVGHTGSHRCAKHDAGQACVDEVRVVVDDDAFNLHRCHAFQSEQRQTCSTPERNSNVYRYLLLVTESVPRMRRKRLNTLNRVGSKLSRSSRCSEHASSQF